MTIENVHTIPNATLVPEHHSPIDEATMMHGCDWAGEDLAGWYVSEKLHGCRAFWDGAALWSRGGHEIRIPDAWRAELPQVALDGEIWAGRDDFTPAQRAVQWGRFDKRVRFLVFDAPGEGSFHERQARVRAAVSGLRCAAAVPHRRVASTAEALTQLRQVQASRGEGLVARYPGNAYAPGYTRQILKLKTAVPCPVHDHPAFPPPGIPICPTPPPGQRREGGNLIPRRKAAA